MPDACAFLGNAASVQINFPHARGAPKSWEVNAKAASRTPLKLTRFTRPLSARVSRPAQFGDLRANPHKLIFEDLQEKNSKKTSSSSPEATERARLSGRDRDHQRHLERSLQPAKLPAGCGVHQASELCELSPMGLQGATVFESLLLL